MIDLDKLHVWCVGDDGVECDYIVAGDRADALAVCLEQFGFSESEVHEDESGPLVAYPDDEPIEIWVDCDGAIAEEENIKECSPLTLLAGEWAKRNGRGLLAGMGHG